VSDSTVVQPFAPQRPRAHSAQPQGVLVQQAAEDGHDDVISSATWAFGQDDNTFVRWSAAYALGMIGPGANEAVAALIAALEDPDAQVRGIAADALGMIGPGAKQAVPALIAALKDVHARVRGSAAAALRGIGQNPDGSFSPRNLPPLPAKEVRPGATQVISALTTALKDPNASVRNTAADALVAVVSAARDAKRTDVVEQIDQAAKTLEANSLIEQAKRVRIDVDLLRAIQPPWYEVVYMKAGKHPRITGVAAAYLFLALVWLGLLWQSPLTLWRINAALAPAPNVTIPITWPRLDR